jgi:hypothetical protein
VEISSENSYTAAAILNIQNIGMNRGAGLQLAKLFLMIDMINCINRAEHLVDAKQLTREVNEMTIGVGCSKHD